MSEMRRNTVQFRFPMGCPPPSLMEVAKFLQQLDTDLASIEATYKSAQDRSLYLKFATLEAMEESLCKNVEPRHFTYANGKRVIVRMSIAGANMHYVRVFDLPPELPDADLSSVLGEFGELQHVVREKFPPDLGLDHMYTGVRGVYMGVKATIPSAVVVGNMKARIFYEGLKDTCFLCQGLGHRRDSCPQRQSRNSMEKKKGNSGSSSYADIVSGKGTTSDEQKIAEVSEDDIIEVLEEDEVFVNQSPQEEEQMQQTVCNTEDVSEKERRRKEGLEALEEVAKAITAAMLNPQASQRRAQFAAAGSGSGSSSGSGPRMKVPRRTRY